MLKYPRLAQLLFVALLGSGTAAFAQENPEPPPASAPAPAASEPAAAPAATSDAPAAVPTAEEPPVVAAAAKPVAGGQLGFAARWRYVTVPSWFLGMFAEKNQPLNSLKAFGFEAFWRKQDREDRNRTWEIVLSGGYQDMSPSDGIWLGRGKNVNLDADLVQAKGFGLVTFDAAYVLRQYFSPYFGIHYGAGLGLGIVRGKILRTSATHFQDGTTEVVVPGVCGRPNPPCNEAELKATEANPPDNGPTDPHRFQETQVPAAIPIINLLVGLDFRIPLPDTSNIEFRLEGGFYNAFFVGLTAGYVLKAL